MSKGYQGSANFKFEVERYLFNGKLYNGDESDCPENVEYVLFELEISGTAYFSSGRNFGPAESCYPDEGETEITEILYNGKPWEGQLTKSEMSAVEEKIVEDVCDGFSEPDYDEPDFDDA